jgi:hypothetical protein
MKLLTSSTIWIVIFFCLSGCNRLIQGAPAAAPTGVTVTKGDTSAIVSWNVVPGVQYFVYWDNGSNVSIDSCNSSPTCVAAAYVTSPFTISGLVNGTQYSVTVNGRTEGAKGGPGSPAVSFIPIQAGLSGTWVTGSALGNTLNGLTYGSIYSSTGVSLGNGYVAAGANSALYYGIVDGTGTLNWTAIANPLPSNSLNGVANSGTTYVAVGAGGNLLYSPNYAETWTQLAATTTSTTTAATLPACSQYCDLNAIYSLNGFFIAAGQNGRILYSLGGLNWTLQNSGTGYSSTGNTGHNFHSITYGNGVYVAVGDTGAILTSTNAADWIPATVTSPTTANLTGVTYGYVVSVSATSGAVTYSPTFVALGAGGVVLTGTFAGSVLTWTSQTIPLSPMLTAVTFGTRTGGNATNQYTIAAEGQFVAVDNTGNVFTSPDGVTWTSQSQTLGALNAIASGLYDYTAVGSNGQSVHSM